MLASQYTEQQQMDLMFRVMFFGDPEAIRQIDEDEVHMASDGVTMDGLPQRKSLVSDGNGGEYYVCAIPMRDDDTNEPTGPQLVAVFPSTSMEAVYDGQFETWEEALVTYEATVAAIEAGTFVRSAVDA